MDKSVSLTLSTDEDGFVSQECPSCERRFKVVFGAGSEKPISFCPYCSHEGTGCWWTSEQAEYISAVAAAEIIGPELESMARDINSRGSASSFVRMTMTIEHPETPIKPEEPNDPMPTAEFSCCNER